APARSADAPPPCCGRSGGGAKRKPPAPIAHRFIFYKTRSSCARRRVLTQNRCPITAIFRRAGAKLSGTRRKAHSNCQKQNGRSRAVVQGRDRLRKPSERLKNCGAGETRRPSSSDSNLHSSRRAPRSKRSLQAKRAPKVCSYRGSASFLRCHKTCRPLPSLWPLAKTGNRH